ncbi:MAG: macro domain-containing protein [Planctomycetota bacterium]
MRIILCSIDEPLAQAWRTYCGKLEGVEVHHGNILDLKVDAVVSPANSFGFMDGGIDLVYSRHFGWNVQKQLQSQIRHLHHGELLVGHADIVETHHSNIPYLIAAPTMRVPMVLADTVNPYLAARAALLLIKHGRFPSGTLEGELISDGVKSVAFPGLGTGVGRVEPEKCALQVRNAIKEIVFDEYEFPTSWADAQMRHQQMYTDKFRDLQY